MIRRKDTFHWKSFAKLAVTISSYHHLMNKHFYYHAKIHGENFHSKANHKSFPLKCLPYMYKFCDDGQLGSFNKPFMQSASPKLCTIMSNYSINKLKLYLSVAMYTCSGSMNVYVQFHDAILFACLHLSL